MIAIETTLVVMKIQGSLENNMIFLQCMCMLLLKHEDLG